MDREISSTTQYKPVTVDVPEDRLAEFHAFFARFLAGPEGRGRAPWQAARRPAWARPSLRRAPRDLRAKRADNGAD